MSSAALPIRMVVATRENEADFFTRTATGRSVDRFRSLIPELHVRCYCDNTAGLPVIYNTEIEACRDEETILVFIHDDVHICDWWWNAKLTLALRSFHLIGVVGNRARHPFQGSWAMWDYLETMSGSIAVGPGLSQAKVTCTGITRQEVKLLDGLFLCGLSSTFLRHNIRFDERFSFHLYDLDICRQFETAGLRMGTWDIALIHESLSDFTSREWEKSCVDYFVKWGD